MSPSFIILLLTFAFLNINSQAQTSKKAQAKIYGQSVTPGNSVAASAIPSLLASKDSVALKVTGQVQNVCQAKGCWMDVKLTDNSVMKVKFKDYGFFVPKDIKGKTVVIKGMAYKEEISVADQRHYAQDAGKSAAEIKSINQPKQSITFKADGVLIK